MNFKIGDRVRCIDHTTVYAFIQKGKTYTVSGTPDVEDVQARPWVTLKGIVNGGHESGAFLARRFTIVPPPDIADFED